jgi:hypothetical protein
MREKCRVAASARATSSRSWRNGYAESTAMPGSPCFIFASIVRRRPAAGTRATRTGITGREQGGRAARRVGGAGPAAGGGECGWGNFSW